MSEEKLRAALHAIETILISPEWYDGEEAMERLLDQLGHIVSSVIPDEESVCAELQQ